MRAKNCVEKNAGLRSSFNIIRSVLTLLLLSVGAATGWSAPGADLSRLRKQIEAAETADDKPAIVELGKRIVALVPSDDTTWDEVAANQFVLEEFDRFEQTLDAWLKAKKTITAAMEDFRGDLANKRKNYADAEKHWLAFLTRKPSREDAALICEKLADACVEQSRWADNEKYLAKAIAARDSAARRVAHAIALLRLHRWDAALAEMTKANRMDSSDAQVKEWLPEFDRLRNFLPAIKALDQRLAQSPNDYWPLLDQARLFTFAGRAPLAEENCERAMKLEPASMCARIQRAEAFYDLNRPQDAIKLEVSAKLPRDKDGHVAEQQLRDLEQNDAHVIQNPSADALAARAKTLSELKQFTLALVDARAAAKVDNRNAGAHAEAARCLMELGQSLTALTEIRQATDLAPDDAAIWFLRGKIEAARADFTGAIKSLTRSLAIEESVPALRLREECERRSGALAAAETDAKRLTELAPLTE